MTLDQKPFIKWFDVTLGIDFGGLCIYKVGVDFSIPADSSGNHKLFKKREVFWSMEIPWIFYFPAPQAFYLALANNFPEKVFLKTIFLTRDFYLAFSLLPEHFCSVVKLLILLNAFKQKICVHSFHWPLDLLQLCLDLWIPGHSSWEAIISSTYSLFSWIVAVLDLLFLVLLSTVSICLFLID